MSRKIEKSYLVIDGKKVPYLKIPPGMSGLTAEVKMEIDTKVANLEEDEFDMNEKDPQLEAEIEGYLSSGNIDDYHAENFYGADYQNNNIQDLFDKIEE